MNSLSIAAHFTMEDGHRPKSHPKQTLVSVASLSSMKIVGGSLIPRASRSIGMLCNGTIVGGTKMRIVGAIITIVSVVSFCLPATAEGKTGDQKRENPHIVFSSFFAPGNSSQSKRVNVPVTLVFEVTKGTDTKRFCQNSPRILDAVMRDLYKKPIKIRKNRAINLPVLGARLTSVANGAIKKDTVVTTQVFDKVFTGKSGKTISAYWKKCTAR
jgi:hypothetical protein